MCHLKCYETWAVCVSLISGPCSMPRWGARTGGFDGQHKTGDGWWFQICMYTIVYIYVCVHVEPLAMIEFPDSHLFK